MPRGGADVLDVDGAEALLAGGQQRVRRLLDAQEVGLERLHARGREQHRRVEARGHERPAGRRRWSRSSKKPRNSSRISSDVTQRLWRIPARRRRAGRPRSAPARRRRPARAARSSSPRSVQGTGRRAVAQLDRVDLGAGACRRASRTRTPVGGQRRARPDGHGVGARVGAQDVERLGRAADLQAAALADGEAVRAAVAADDAPGDVDDVARALAQPAVAGQEAPRARCRPGSTGPASRAWRPPAARARRRSRGPAPCRARRAGSAAARASRATARPACRPGPWPGRRPGAAGPRACGARSGRWPASRRRRGRRRRASRRGARRRCSARTGWASGRRRGRPATARRRPARNSSRRSSVKCGRPMPWAMRARRARRWPSSTSARRRSRGRATARASRRPRRGPLRSAATARVDAAAHGHERALRVDRGRCVGGDRRAERARERVGGQLGGVELARAQAAERGGDRVRADARGVEHAPRRARARRRRCPPRRRRRSPTPRSRRRPRGRPATATPMRTRSPHAAPPAAPSWRGDAAAADRMAQVLLEALVGHPASVGRARRRSGVGVAAADAQLLGRGDERVVAVALAAARA